MTSALTEDRILGHVRKQERNLLRSISWISIGIAILYVCGYMWRVCYYVRLGIPVSFVDFPFPEILIPKPHLFAFMVQALFVIGYESYNKFYIREKRLQRATAMGIDAPLEKLHDYAFQKNLSSPNKINYEVFVEFLTEYIKANYKDDAQWKFNRDDFDSNALKLFENIPYGLKSSFVSYCLQFFDMDKSKTEQTIKDAVGFPPEGSKIYEKIQIVVLWLFISWFIVAIIFGIPGVLLTTIYMVLGVIVGVFLIKVSKVKARWQMWHSILISIIILVALNGIDGYLTAQYKLKNNGFLLAKIVKTDGKEQIGLLLGSFNDGYILAVSDPNDIYNLRKFHKHSVVSLNYTTMRRLNQSMDKLKKQIEENKKELQALNEKAKVE